MSDELVAGVTWGPPGRRERRSAPHRVVGTPAVAPAVASAVVAAVALVAAPAASARTATRLRTTRDATFG